MESRRGGPWRRRLLGTATVLGMLLLVQALLAGQAPPRDPTPMPWRARQPIHWGVDLGAGVHRTHLGQLVDLEPDPPGFRIAVFGSSAVAGTTTSLFHAFPWRLQRRLERRGLDAQVVNMGLPGQDSAQHRTTLERSLAELHPDLVVVYAGNNELHRLRAYRSLTPLWTASWERVRLALEHLALYRWLSALPLPRAAEARPERLPGLHEIRAPVTAPDRALAAMYFRSNLEGMADACRAAGVPMVVCTVAANDDYDPDYGRPPDPDVAGALERGPARAVQAFPDSAHAHLALGRQERERGDFATARREMELARELDPAPNRMLPSMNQVVREVASEHRVVLCDLEEGLRGRAPDGLLGPAIFLDNCHFNRAGNELVALLLETRLAQTGLLPPGPVGASPPDDAGGVEAMAVEGWRSASPAAARVAPFYRPWLDVLVGGLDAPAVATLEAACLREPGRREAWRELERAAVLANRPGLALKAGRRFLAQGGTDPAVVRDVRLLERLVPLP